MVKKNDEVKKHSAKEVMEVLKEVAERMAQGSYPQELTYFQIGEYVEVRVRGIGKARNYITHDTIPTLQELAARFGGATGAVFYNKERGVFVMATLYTNGSDDNMKAAKAASEVV
jgi:hypothetical protein